MWEAGFRPIEVFKIHENFCEVLSVPYTTTSKPCSIKGFEHVLTSIIHLHIIEVWKERNASERKPTDRHGTLKIEYVKFCKVM